MQLSLAMPETVSTPAERWWSLPDRAQSTVLALLARMIADGVIDNEEAADDDAHG